MSYGYSATTNMFYVVEDKEGYESHGNWPKDVKPIPDETWAVYCVQGPPGKQGGPNKDGMPCWVDIPPPTLEQQFEAAEQKKTLLMKNAAKAIAPLQDAEDLGMATNEEKAALLAWKKYRVLLNRLDTAKAAEIVWPSAPK